MKFSSLMNVIEQSDPISVHGKVTKVVGMVVEGRGIGLRIGEICRVFPEKESEAESVICEVVGFRESDILLMPLGGTRGLGPGSRIVKLGHKARVRIGNDMLGRIVDGSGNVIDGKGQITRDVESHLYKSAPNPFERRRITAPLDVGIRAINTMLTVGSGQRMGIFAGSGVGKSVLLGMMARNTSADVSVIALIGERGREVKEFIEKHLKEEGLRRSVVVVVTSDKSPLLRIRGSFLAMSIAEHFRDQGKQVLLIMDSLTRFCMAQREIGLAVGEPPTTRGYPPSVFSLLPRLLERTGTTRDNGTITGFYTVLVEGDDMNEPIADAARAILDGHIVLSRDLAAAGHFPAIDPLSSTSRCMLDIISEEHKLHARRVRGMISTYNRNIDLITIGAYQKGRNSDIDRAVENIDRINNFLMQGIDEKVDFDDSLQGLYGLNLGVA